MKTKKPTKKTAAKKKVFATKPELTEIIQRDEKAQKILLSVFERLAKAQEQQVEIAKQMVERLNSWEKIFMKLIEKEDPEQYAIITSATNIKDIRDGN